MNVEHASIQGFTPLGGEEIQHTRGGALGIAALILIGLAGAAGAEIFGDWDNFKAGLMGDPEINH